MKIGRRPMFVAVLGLSSVAVGLGCAPEQPLVIPEGALWGQVTYEQDYPRTREHCWSHEAQGVTHDVDSWYIATQDALFKYHVTADLEHCRYTRRVGLPSWTGPGCPTERCECGHFGDPAFHDGELFVPLEKCVARTAGGSVKSRLRDRVFVYNRDLTVTRIGTLNGEVQYDASWVSIDPATGLLWSGPTDMALINVYSPSFDGHSTLELLYTIPLDGTYPGVQGVAFDGQGGFYLSSFNQEDSGQSGVYVFFLDSTSASLAPRQFIPPRGGYNQGFGSWDEMEGVTFWDVDPLGAPGIRGQLHWIVLDNDADQDDVTFEHVSLSDHAPVPVDEVRIRRPVWPASVRALPTNPPPVATLSRR